MKDKDMQKAKALISKARQLCDANGGPSEEQAALLQLLTSRLPGRGFQGCREGAIARRDVPGHHGSTDSKVVVLPGTPSMADLAAKAKAKQQAAAEARAMAAAKAEAEAAAAKAEAEATAAKADAVQR